MKCLHCGTPFEASESATQFCCEGCEEVHSVMLSGMAFEKGEFHPDVFYNARKDHFVFYVPSLKCAACLWLVRGAVSKVTNVSSVKIDLSERTVSVGFDTGKLPDLEMLIKALRSIGYIPFPAHKHWMTVADKSQRRRKLKEIGVAAVAFANVMLLSAAVYLAENSNKDILHQRFFVWLSFAITLGSLFVTSRELVRNAWLALKARKLHVDQPILFSMAVAFALSVLNLLQGSVEVYFDSITGLLFFLLVGRYLHDALLDRANRLTQAAPSALPERAKLFKKGEKYSVTAGEFFAADGIVEQGISEVNEALLTGEARLVTKGPKDFVYAGTQNILGTVTVKVTACEQETRLWQILKSIESSARNRSVYQNAIDKILPYFVLLTFLLACFGAALWWNTNSEMAIRVFVTTLIVCCPCALALALPLASTFYLRRAWQHGAMVKSPDVFERLSEVNTIVLDKTGTLTTGKISVMEKITSANASAFLEFRIKSLATKSRHPVSTAVAKGLVQGSFEFESTEELPGKGIMGTDALGNTHRLGKESWLRGCYAHMPTVLQQLDELSSKVKGGDAVYGTDGSGFVAYLLHDPVRSEAANLLQVWLDRGFKVFVASGDSKEHCQNLALELGISPECAKGELTPENKLSFVKELQSTGKKVLFIGDGINDAAAAKQADVSIAVSGSIDIAIHSSDVVFDRAGLTMVEDLRWFSKYVVTSLRLLLATSASYNIIAVTLALLGIIHPLVAALIMPLASVTVLLISLVRKGDHVWTSSLLSCPLPSSLPVGQRLSFGGLQGQDNGMI